MFGKTQLCISRPNVKIQVPYGGADAMWSPAIFCYARHRLVQFANRLALKFLFHSSQLANQIRTRSTLPQTGHFLSELGIDRLQTVR